MLKGWVSAGGSHCGQEGRAGYYCVELDMWEVWHEAEKCVEPEHCGRLQSQAEALFIIIDNSYYSLGV